AAPVSVAVLDFELVDSSLEGAMRGVDEAETKRLVLPKRCAGNHHHIRPRRALRQHDAGKRYEIGFKHHKSSGV
ncbi:MAG TPA: hypothetical protein VKA94_11930, partial [Hyphomicrobiales bacterium]|nr:hypothetical protein [Hyphomicrobiales bacterium]